MNSKVLAVALVGALASMFSIQANACTFLFGRSNFRPDSPAFINRPASYCEAAGRPGSPAEMAAWGDTDYYSMYVGILNYYRSQPQEYAAMVQKAYRDALDRSATSNEVSVWTSHLQAGNQVGYGRIVEAIRSSIKSTMTVNGTAFDSMIVRAYQKGGGRNPTADEISVWRAHLAEGYNFHDILFAVSFYSRNPGTVAEIRASNLVQSMSYTSDVVLSVHDLLTGEGIELFLPSSCRPSVESAVAGSRNLRVRGQIANRYTPYFIFGFGFGFNANTDCQVE